MDATTAIKERQQWITETARWLRTLGFDAPVARRWATDMWEDGAPR